MIKHFTILFALMAELADAEVLYWTKFHIGLPRTVMKWASMLLWVNWPDRMRGIVC